jgi:hypothetical protein
MNITVMRNDNKGKLLGEIGEIHYICFSANLEKKVILKSLRKSQVPLLSLELFVIG